MLDLKCLGNRDYVFLSSLSTCRTYPSPPCCRRRRRGVLERVLLLPPLDQRQVAK